MLIVVCAGKQVDFFSVNASNQTRQLYRLKKVSSQDMRIPEQSLKNIKQKHISERNPECSPTLSRTNKALLLAGRAAPSCIMLSPHHYHPQSQYEACIIDETHLLGYISDSRGCAAIPTDNTYAFYHQSLHIQPLNGFNCPSY